MEAAFDVQRVDAALVTEFLMERHDPDFYER